MLIHHLDTLLRGILHKVTLLLKGMLHSMVLLLLLRNKLVSLKDGMYLSLSSRLKNLVTCN
jgi:hypothetical protein